MNYGDVCTGISAASVAWAPLGWKAQFFSEIEPFPCKVLKHHYPQVPNLGDMMKLTENKTFLDANIDVLVGGTPCQSFSLAGLRGGLSDDRGNLALQYCRLLVIKRPQWFVWENVPGVFSSFSDETPGENLEGTGPGNERDFTETADFATLLTAFRECGYCCAWRVLDAQFFGVPQRRRRVFVVGYFGDDWRPPAAVLFDGDGGKRHIKEIEKARQEVAGTINAGIGKRRGAGTDPELLVWPKEITGTLDADFADKCGQNNQHINAGAPFFVPCWWDGGQVSQTLDAVLYKGQTMPEKNRFPAVLTPKYFESRIARNGRDGLEDIAAPLKAESGGTGKGDSAGMVIYPLQQISSPTNGSNPQPGDPAPTMHVNGNLLLVPAIRKLTPMECERLQGFPDLYTAIPGAKDGPRYKSLGNSMAVPVMGWIGARIDAVNRLLNKK